MPAPFTDDSDACRLENHQACTILWEFDGDLENENRLCICECHEQARAEAITWIINLRDHVTDPFQIDVQAVAGATCEDPDCVITAQNHIINALGDALTFLGYPNGGEA